MSSAYPKIAKMLSIFANSVFKYLLKKINSSSAISQHLINNPKCFENYKVDNFKIISIARNKLHLKIKRNLFTRPFCLIR